MRGLRTTGEKAFLWWTINRRRFLQLSVLAGMASWLGVWTSCKRERSILSEREIALARSCFLYLFPPGDGPSAEDIRCVAHFQNILSDPRYDPDIKAHYLQGLRRAGDQLQAMHGQSNNALSGEVAENFWNRIKEQYWGERWLSSMLNVVIEALLLDEIYGVNPNGVGWRWLGHVPGQPRPNVHNYYPRILERKKEHHFIQSLDQL